MPKAKSETTTKAPRKAKAEGRKTRVKKDKDPNKPKRPMTAFFIFSGEFRDAVKAENPEAKVGQIAKLLGERWRSMSDEEKAPYAEKVKAEKARYDREMAIYEARGTEEAEEEEEEEDDE
ncbi:Non-histone chromosomal protein 6 [Blastocladiella emersonii ATCC 22665]|nr:Non-histone chromosomal protein 6 [Blastocladiella emersonii ATCC 22665]